MLSNNIKKLLVSSSALLMMLSAGTGTVSAKRVHHAHHARVAYIAKSYNSRRNVNRIYGAVLHKTIKGTRISNSLRKQFKAVIPKLSYPQLLRLYGELNFSDLDKTDTRVLVSRFNTVSTHGAMTLQRQRMSHFERNFAKYELQDINRVRKVHHKAPVKLGMYAQKIADARVSKAYQDNLNNVDAHEQSDSHFEGALVDTIDKLGLSDEFNGLSSSETLDDFTLGTDIPCSADDRGALYYYTAHNAKQLANAVTNIEVYHDAGADWVHRETILGDYNHVGIASYYDFANNTATSVEVYLNA